MKFYKISAQQAPKWLRTTKKSRSSKTTSEKSWLCMIKFSLITIKQAPESFRTRRKSGNSKTNRGTSWKCTLKSYLRSAQQAQKLLRTRRKSENSKTSWRTSWKCTIKFLKSLLMVPSSATLRRMLQTKSNRKSTSMAMRLSSQPLTMLVVGLSLASNRVWIENSASSQMTWFKCLSLNLKTYWIGHEEISSRKLKMTLICSKSRTIWTIKSRRLLAICSTSFLP